MNGQPLGQREAIHLPPARLRQTLTRLANLRTKLDLIYQERSHEWDISTQFGEREPRAADDRLDRLRVLRTEATHYNKQFVLHDVPVLWCTDHELVREWLMLMPGCLADAGRIDEGDLDDSSFSTSDPPKEAGLLRARTIILHWQIALGQQIGDRPRVFIASSSEGEGIAEAVRERLSARFDSFVWSDVIRPGATIIEGLEEAANTYDFGIFVLRDDDIREHRGATEQVPRDNVVFELGIFVGRYSRYHALILKPRAVTLPSDLAGVVPVLYDPSPTNLEASLDEACTKIDRAMQTAIGLTTPSSASRQLL